MEEEYNLIKMKQRHNLSKTKDVINPMILMGVEDDDYVVEDDSSDIMDRFAG